jgi:hypothetical protein
MSTDNGAGKLGKLAFGLALGTVWGLSLFVVGLLGTFCDYGVSFVSAFGKVYLGFEPTVLGAFIGLLWGFFDFFIFGFLIALFYNWFSCCCKCGK